MYYNLFICTAHEQPQTLTAEQPTIQISVFPKREKSVDNKPYCWLLIVDYVIVLKNRSKAL